ncbi:hypothetical protein PF008_g28792 [Phytophthora fragariae]|uniref:TRP C-terminal domain-containing protein n=1 Tax=Phytophthora fragariae TaxID=53985 RepID=A0A6G0QAE5_9STRA|nr:hypothetical protein PF008_g28792 [Phytophthora fragariae]
MGLLCCAAKCCGCMVLSQLCALLLPLILLAALALLFYTYAIPWGEDQIRQALHLAADVDIGSLNASYVEANSCSGCVFGSNTQWPMNSTGTRHFLDSQAGSTASGVIATSLAGAAVIGAGSMLWASAMPSAAAALSFSGGFYEMTHIVEQAQFAGMISQLRIEGAPTFLLQFSKELSWTNFNLIKSISDNSSGSGSAGDSSDDSTRRLEGSSSSATGVFAAAGESGPARYAALIGVNSDDLFFYTLVTFVVVVAVLHALYLVVVVVVGSMAKNESFGDVARKWYRKVIWASVLALLLAQYMFAMAGSFFISEGSSNASANDSSQRFALGIAALAAVVLLALGLGIIVVGNNTDELKDVGTYEHDQRAFSNKYSAYYDEYNFDNRFFFVPRILLTIMTGAIVGIVRDATTQLLCILAITMVYLILLLIRQPNLLRFLFYIGIASVFMKVVLICLMLIVARDDYFPQTVRDNVAYGIIGVNMFIFFLLFVRQAYTIIRKMVVSCRHKEKGKENSLDATDINLEFGNTNTRTYEQVDSTPAGRGADWYEKQQQQQQQLNQAQEYPQRQQQYQSQQYQSQQYQSQASTMSGYSTTQSSRSGHSDHVPMLEPSPVAIPASNHSRGNIRPPVSRNQQYSFGGSTRSINANNTAPAPAPQPAAPIPTYDVLAAYLGTNNTTEATAYSTSPRSGRGQSSRGQHLSSRGLNSSQGPHSSRGLALSRGPLSSRGQSSRGGAALSGSGLYSRPSTVPLDAYAGSFSGTDSAVSSSSSRRRHKDIDIDEVGIDDDIVAAPPASSTSRQQFAPGASKTGHNFAPGASSTSSCAMMEQSYVNFSDSMVSSASSQMGMTQASVRPGNTFSAAMGNQQSTHGGGFGSSPQGKMSMFSNDSDNSFDGDSSGWFKHRSKTVVSVDSSDTNDSESQSYELGPLGVTTSAFSARGSVDSYYQSTANLASSRVDFNAQSQFTDNGSDDGTYHPTHRRGTGSSNQSSNQSFLSAQSDDSMGVDGEKVRYDDHNSLTL